VVQAVRGRYKRKLVYNWAASFFGMKERHHDTISFSGRKVTVATDPPLPISIDGEVLAKTPVTARVAAAVIEVMAPPAPQPAGSTDGAASG
jgi:diacylglycerol kinase family enzyme